jgi:hypothetical protein
MENLEDKNDTPEEKKISNNLDEEKLAKEFDDKMDGLKNKLKNIAKEEVEED